VREPWPSLRVLASGVGTINSRARGIYMHSIFYVIGVVVVVLVLLRLAGFA
jgi:hypothetical protein